MPEVKPAKNYRKRVRRLLEAILAHVRVVAGPRYREPSPEMMEHFIDCFHHVMNWCLDGAARLGYPVEHYHGPLSEDQLRRVERIFLRQSYRRTAGEDS